MRHSRELSRFLENHPEVAASFDPSRTALTPFTLASDGKPQRTVQIGDMIEVPDMDGKSVRVAVEEISSWGDDKAVLAISRIGVCIWPIASFRRAAEFGRYLGIADSGEPSWPGRFMGSRPT